MANTYETYFGYDWPKGITMEFAGLVLGKKWREYRAAGVDIKDPWEPLLTSMHALFGDNFKTPEWTLQHVHDWVMEESLVTWGCGSCGKALLPDEPVYTPTGTTTIGKLSVGDLVMTATGHPATVRKIFDHLDHDLYRVRFTDGTETVCDEGHLWTVRFWGRVHRKGPRTTRKAVMGFRTETIPVTRLASWTVRRLRTVSVPLTRPVEFQGGPLPLDPYVLGCLLGDGTFTGNLMLTQAPGETELLEEFRRRLSITHPGYVLKQYGSTWNIVKASGDKSANQVKSVLKSLGLLGKGSPEKFIPEVYKFASLDDRLDLLAGMFDTDGTVGKTGAVIFCTTSERLKEDVRFVLESIGASVTVTIRHSTYTSGAARLTGRPAYTIAVHGLPASMLRRLFKLSRKRGRIRDHRRHDGYKSILSVEKIRNRSDYPRETRCITLSETDILGNPVNGLFPVGHFTVTHNSNDTGALIVVDWVVDPYDTTTLVGSTTKDALRIRTWESVERYFALLKANSRFAIPGKMMPSGYQIVNDRDGDSDPMAQGAKAGIHGVALNDGGKLQGAHSRYVRLVIDELATINNHDGKGGILETIDNLQIAHDFKFAALANPEGWADPSSQYCIPEGGIDSVNVDTGSWRSTFGCFVRHHDGLKSLCIRDPSKIPEFPYLTRQKHVNDALRRSHGNRDSPRFWKMVRGFPVPTVSGAPTVLDIATATKNRVDECVDFEPSSVIAVAAGCDPAWSEGGDGACYARCYVRYDSFGRPFLDFTGGLQYLEVRAELLKETPVTQQLANGVVNLMRAPGSAPFRNLAVDASGNQGLADHLKIFYGADCLAVNSAVRASDAPLRANDPDPASEGIQDRGTEAWCVLAEFCRAGQVKGLPPDAMSALVQRRFMEMRGTTMSSRLRLEKKEDFKVRFGRSPDECDACALAALAVKERVGILPYGFVPERPDPASMFRNYDSGAPALPDPVETWDAPAASDDGMYQMWA